MMNTILYAAFKYTLGRTSYCVFEMSQILRKYNALLAETTRSQMVLDIDAAEKVDRLGHECDVRDWKMIRELLRSTPQTQQTTQDVGQAELESLFIYATRYFLRVNDVNPELMAFVTTNKSIIPHPLRSLVMKEVSEHIVLCGAVKWSILVNELRDRVL